MDERARAQQLFESALADVEKGDYAAACPKFLASQRADPKTSTLLNLGACYEANGQTASAWGAFKEGAVFAKKLGRDDWVKSAMDKAMALEPKLVRLTIQAPATRPDGLEIRRDADVLIAGEYGVAIPVDPGEHVVVARAPWYREVRQKVIVKDASQTIAIPNLEHEAVAAPPPVVAPPANEAPPPPPSFWSTPRILGAAVAGVGVVGLGVGAGLALGAKSTYDDAKATCASGTTGCAPNAPNDANKAFDRAGVATGVFVAGGVLVAAGAAVFFFVPSSKSVAIAPAPGGIVARGTFR